MARFYPVMADWRSVRADFLARQDIEGIEAVVDARGFVGFTVTPPSAAVLREVGIEEVGV